jgi:methyl-accepting chemotaxis protein
MVEPPQKNDNAVAASSRSFLICIALIGLGFGFLILEKFTAARSAEASLRQLAQMQNVNGEVLRLDEALTMSAKMGAATADPAWRERYDTLNTQMDKAIGDILALAPTAIAERYKAQTSAANDRLVILEKKAFDQTAKGDKDGALKTLDSEVYSKDKKLLGDGSDRFIADLTLSLETSLDNSRWLSILFMGLACAGTVLASLFLILFINRLNKARLSYERMIVEHRASEEARANAEVERDATIALRLERAQQIEKAITSFRSEIDMSLHSIEDEFAHLRQSAADLASASDQGSASTATVTRMAATMSDRAGAVSRMTQTVSDMIGEIAVQVSSTTSAMSETARDSEIADQQFHALGEAVGKIGGVITLIQQVAAQTNLLALNATIEAARAGEAGRGFAVVAAEVKSLATQTASATDEIAAQINAIEQATQAAIESIARIVKRVQTANQQTQGVHNDLNSYEDRLNGMSSDVSTISRDSSTISQHLSELSNATAAATQTAKSLLTVSGNVEQSTQTMRATVSSFLRKVAA